MGLLGKIFGIVPKQPPIHVNDENFEREVLQATEPVVLDIWSPQCGPCKLLEPIMMELAATYEGRVKVCEMGVHAAPKAATKLGVHATPTVVYLQRGKELDRVAGFRGSLYHNQTITELFGIDPQ